MEQQPGSQDEQASNARSDSPDDLTPEQQEQKRLQEQQQQLIRETQNSFQAISAEIKTLAETAAGLTPTERQAQVNEIRNKIYSRQVPIGLEEYGRNVLLTQLGGIEGQLVLSDDDVSKTERLKASRIREIDSAKTKLEALEKVQITPDNVSEWKGVIEDVPKLLELAKQNPDLIEPKDLHRIMDVATAIVINDSVPLESEYTRGNGFISNYRKIKLFLRNAPEDLKNTYKKHVPMVIRSFIPSVGKNKKPIDKVVKRPAAKVRIIENADQFFAMSDAVAAYIAEGNHVQGKNVLTRNLARINKVPRRTMKDGRGIEKKADELERLSVLFAEQILENEWDKLNAFFLANRTISDEQLVFYSKARERLVTFFSGANASYKDKKIDRSRGKVHNRRLGFRRRSLYWRVSLEKFANDIVNKKNEELAAQYFQGNKQLAESRIVEANQNVQIKQLQAQKWQYEEQARLNPQLEHNPQYKAVMSQIDSQIRGLKETPPQPPNPPNRPVMPPQSNPTSQYTAPASSGDQTIIVPNGSDPDDVAMQDISTLTPEDVEQILKGGDTDNIMKLLNTPYGRWVQAVLNADNEPPALPAKKSKKTIDPTIENAAKAMGSRPLPKWTQGNKNNTSGAEPEMIESSTVRVKSHSWDTPNRLEYNIPIGELRPNDVDNIIASRDKEVLVQLAKIEKYRTKAEAALESIRQEEEGESLYQQQANNTDPDKIFVPSIYNPLELEEMQISQLNSQSLRRLLRYGSDTQIQKLLTNDKYRSRATRILKNRESARE